MRHLNYNHLHYFWTVAREGSIARASDVLHLTPQTISGQLKLLEEAVGEPLFHRVGRGLVLSETGHFVNHYADEIFSLGAELSQRVRNKESGSAVALNVGIVDSIPKLIACRILRPAMSIPNDDHPDASDDIRIVCREGSLEHLLGELAVHRLDLVLSDRPLPTGLHVKAYNHRLGESPVAFFVQKQLAARYTRKFPRSMVDAPMLLPLSGTVLRRSLDDWFEKQGLVPNIVAEFDDSALLKVFGDAGIGIFPAPKAIADEVAYMYRAREIGVAEGVTETFYAISPERRLKHPSVVRITELARESLFS